MWIATIAALAAQDAGWFKSPEDAKGPAAKASKPILLVTICAPPG